MFYSTTSSIKNIDQWVEEIRKNMLHEIVNETSYIYEINNGKIQGELLVAGFSKEEISVKAHPKYIDISGKMKEPRYRRIKSTFHKRITFTKRIDPETIKLKLDQGVLSFECSLEEAKQVISVEF